MGTVLSLEVLREELRAPQRAVEPAPRWGLSELAGRLVELCGHGASACVTLAFSLVHEAQQFGEPAAWVTDVARSFFPPDAAAFGVDLEALAVIRLADVEAVPRAADPLLRSGAFGLVVLDLRCGKVPAPLQTRLLGLAHQHHSAVVFLTEKREDAPSLGSLVSLRAEAVLRAVPEGFHCALRVLKDKKRAPGWQHAEVFRGPDGLR